MLVKKKKTHRVNSFSKTSETLENVYNEGAEPWKLRTLCTKTKQTGLLPKSDFFRISVSGILLQDSKPTADIIPLPSSGSAPRPSCIIKS